MIDDVAPISAPADCQRGQPKAEKSRKIEDLADRMEAAKSSLQRKKGGKQMIPIVKADGTVELEFIRQLKKRSGEVDEKVNQAVAQIIAQVKERGDEAVREYT